MTTRPALMTFVFLVAAAACGTIDGKAATLDAHDPASQIDAIAAAGEPDPAKVILNGHARQVGSFDVDGDGVIGGRLAIGIDNPAAPLHVASASDAQAILATFNDTPNRQSYLFLDHARGTPTAPASLASGDEIFRIYGRGYSGGAIRNAVKIAGLVDGPPGAASVPGALQFATSTITSPDVERMRITSDGRVGIGTAQPAYTLDVAGSARIAGIQPFLKGGDNGTASCDTFCRGSQWGPVGACLGGKNTDTGDYLGCADKLPTLGSMVCMCAAIP